jgi:hypothetical protein
VQADEKGETISDVISGLPKVLAKTAELANVFQTRVSDRVIGLRIFYTGFPCVTDVFSRRTFERV